MTLFAQISKIKLLLLACKFESRIQASNCFQSGNLNYLTAGLLNKVFSACYKGQQAKKEKLVAF